MASNQGLSNKSLDILTSMPYSKSHSISKNNCARSNQQEAMLKLQQTNKRGSFRLSNKRGSSVIKSTQSVLPSQPDPLLNKIRGFLQNRQEFQIDSACPQILIILNKAIKGHDLQQQEIKQVLNDENLYEQSKSIIDSVVQFRSYLTQILDYAFKQSDRSNLAQTELQVAVKEQECLELKSRLEKLSFDAQNLLPQPQQDNQNFLSKIGQKQQDFENCIYDLQKLTPILGQQIQSQYESNLIRMRNILEHTIEDAVALNEQKGQFESKCESLLKNTKYLEERLASTLTQKEEQIIKLKSEVIICKSKVHTYKQKLKDAIDGFETKKIKEYEAIKNQEVEALELKLRDADLEVDQIRQENIQVKSTNDELEQKLQQTEESYQKEINQQNLIITQLSERLNVIDKDYAQQISQVDTIRAQTQKKLNLEEKDRMMNSLKLEYLLSNYRKLQQQKRHLEHTIERDLRHLTQEMRKAELLIQRDTYIESSWAKQSLSDMYDILKANLRYVKEVLGFMNFDADQIHNEGPPLKEGASEQYDDPVTKYEKNKIENQINEDLNDNAYVKDQNELTLEQYFQSHIYEIAEVLLSVIGDIYKQAKTQPSMESLRLFEMMQQRTDKQVVSAVYKRFFSSSRIHFAQQIQRFSNQTIALADERDQLKQEVQRLTSQIQAVIDDYEKKNDDAMIKQQQEQQQLQELVEEEIKDHEAEDASTPKKSEGGFRMSFQRNSNNSNHQDGIPINPGDFVQQPASTPKPSYNIRDLVNQLQQAASSSNTRSQPAAAVASAIFKQQEKRMLEMLSTENAALKERIRQTRLTLQRQIYELQQQLTLERETHLRQMNKVKLEFGQDLVGLTSTLKEKELSIIAQIEKDYEQEIITLKQDNETQQQRMAREFQAAIEELREKLKVLESRKEQLESEIRKLKNQSNQIAQGGYGTFTVAFEELHKKNNVLAQLTSNLMTTYGSGQQTPKSPIEGVKEMIAKKLLRQTSSDLHDITDLGIESEVNKDEIALEKLQHFIEVGFLMDPKGFKFMEVYKEKTFDSVLAKHLFEFQDPTDNVKLLQLQHKLRQQVSENFALFNEINPVYVSINLGRAISQFSDEGSFPQESFKLIKREGFYVNGDNYLMVNFLKCEKPQYVLRVIAFENERSQQYSFDLTWDDLMMIAEGNMKLMEDDYIHDLCQLILNNLTLVRRSSPQIVKDEPQLEDESTIQSSRIMLNLVSKSNYPRKQKEGEFPQGFLAVEHRIFFNDHYRSEYDQRNRVILAKHDKRKKGLIQEQSTSTDFQQAAIYEAMDLTFREVQKFGHLEFSLELHRGRQSGHLILKTHALQWDQVHELVLFQDAQSPQVAATLIRAPAGHGVVGAVVALEKVWGFEHFVVRLTVLYKYDSKHNFQWDPSSKPAHGILMHEAFTYYLVERADRSLVRIRDHEILNTEIRSLLFSHAFGYKARLIEFGSLQAVDGAVIKDPIETLQILTQALVLREFGVVRVRFTTTHDGEESDEEIKNYYCSFAFYKSTQTAKIDLFIKIYELKVDLKHRIDQEVQGDAVLFCKGIIDQIVVDKKEGEWMITVDSDIQPMSEILQQLQQQRHDAIVSQDDILKPELDAKQIQLPPQTLVQSPKVTKVTLISRKAFKVTACFLQGVKNLKIPNQQQQNLNWQIILIEAEQRQTSKSFQIAITMNDIAKLSEKLKENSGLPFNEASLLHTKVTKEALLSFILDCLIFKDSQIFLSLNHLLQRVIERQALGDQFKHVGSRFLQKLGQLEDPDLAQFKTGLHQVEVSRKLLINAEKEFADKQYDIKIFELKYDGISSSKKYQVEVVCLDQPTVAYRADFISEPQIGPKIYIERFNLIQQMHKDYQEDKFMRDGMVLVVAEQNFPHVITFMIIEPASNIQWDFTHSDHRLSSVESRRAREQFARLVKEKLEKGMIDWKSSDFIIVSNLGYQKNLIVQGTQSELWRGNLKSAFSSENPTVYGRTLKIQQDRSYDIEVKVVSERNLSSLKLLVIIDKESKEVIFNVECFRQGARLLSGFFGFKLNDSILSLIYTLEVSSALTSQEKAIRLTLQEPFSGEILVDVVFADTHLLKTQTQDDDLFIVSVQNEQKFAFTTGFKEAFSAFMRLPNLQLVYQAAFVTIEKASGAVEEQAQQSQARLMYRKMVQVQSASDQRKVMVFVKYDSEEIADKEWRVVLYDEESGIEDSYIFQTHNILTQDEINIINVKNDRIMKDLIHRVIDTRLQVKAVDSLSLNKPTETRYQVYFIDPPQGSASGLEKMFQHQFDIKCGFHQRLLETESIAFDHGSSKLSTLVNLEKDELIFEISEIINPFEFALRIKIFHRDKLKLLNISDASEGELRKMLFKEQLSYLMESTRRLELARYIASNIIYDATNRKAIFLQSSNSD